MKKMAFLIAVSFGTLAMAALTLAHAQADAHGNTVAVPNYGSSAAIAALSDSNFNTPESDGRPGVKFFTLAVIADKKGDYAHAVDMYKVAASWAYKPAEYNLGLMYFKGHGVPVNRALGAAWMILAAERGEPLYVKARDAMVTLLTNAQFAETDACWSQLRDTYGDKVALRRAKAQWAWAKSQKTGSRVGGAVGELYVGASNTPRGRNQPGRTGKAQMYASGWGFLPSGSLDGSTAYRQFQQSDDPYSPVFLKRRAGEVHIGPLTPVHEHEKKAHTPTPPSSGLRR